MFGAMTDSTLWGWGQRNAANSSLFLLMDVLIIENLDFVNTTCLDRMFDS